MPAEGEFGEGGDVVDDAVGEVGGRADEEDGIAVDEARDAARVDLVGRGGAGDDVQFDFEVLGGFAEGCVGRLGDDPGGRGLVWLWVKGGGEGGGLTSRAR